ncbi:hypothetical protein QAD02_018286 [Eretmocerus hayati]|uniref:Uncharacterized protein n=1 Tax=Eretmocerus hayati TaxID=131215 RepID=A0ACC2PFZ0_9HYME|nr:hypothetical protein QAD02_018286 [Eretmocerus hayati]
MTKFSVVLYLTLWNSWIILKSGHAQDDHHEISDIKEISGTIDLSLQDFSDIENLTSWSISCNSHRLRYLVVCNLRVRQYFLEDKNKIKEDQCQIPLNRVTSSRLIRFSALRFGIEKYFVRWTEVLPSQYNENEEVDEEIVQKKYALHFAMIDMETCNSCGFQLTRIPTKLTRKEANHFFKYSNFLLQESGVDIIYAHSTNIQSTRETFNSSCDKIWGPESQDKFHINDDSVIVINKKASEKNILTRERLKVRYICENTFPCYDGDHDGKIHGLSTSMDKLTYCGMETSNSWSCMKQSANTPSEFRIQFDHQPNRFMVYDISETEILVMTSEIMDGTEIIFLTIFCTDSVRHRSIEFIRLESGLYPDSMSGHFFPGENGDICFHLSWKEDDAQYYSIKCFRKNLFNNE